MNLLRNKINDFLYQKILGEYEWCDTHSQLIQFETRILNKVREHVSVHEDFLVDEIWWRLGNAYFIMLIKGRKTSLEHNPPQKQYTLYIDLAGLHE